ncbi:Heme oxygenase [Hondaea fermentalgiana]|uniref:Heme oxygenase n=1 Tax=Hondaea fermentalgiana TaxID=2315210 RepID=A0A2R5GRP9_9STRA|nr:Heme oxygenase [Hondaea fermentalgiana]|eukprot:GBG33552.1 Heme oxygenase [Hondaea fermentalgiana]
MELAKKLRVDTHEVHREAESAGFMKAFMKGQLNKEEHTAYLVQMYHVYVALEAAYDEAVQTSSDKEKLQTLYFPEELSRVKSLEEDLEFFLGKNWKSNDAIVNPSPAAKTYADRMTELGQKDALLLIPHAYTRYLGDLSGGLMLGEMARKTLQLKGNEGLAFFTFDNVEEPDAFKNEYRARLNALDLSEERIADITEETIKAYKYNIGLFRELDAQFGLNEDGMHEEKAAIADAESSNACCIVM